VSAVDPDEAMVHFQGASLVLAMRLHGLILAALAGSPCAALSYDPKVASAAAALGCPCQSLDAPLAPALVEVWQALLDHAPDPQAVQRLRQQSQVHRALLAQLGSELLRQP
jgi:polysaccharide pyruvyl transferase WcaK-like protein